MRNRLITIIILMILPLACNAALLLPFFQTIRLNKERMDKNYAIGNELFSKHLYNKSAPYIYEYALFYKDLILYHILDYTSEDRRNVYWNKYKDIYVKQVPYLAYSCQTDSLISLALDASIFSKGILLNTTWALKQAVVDSNIALLDTYNRFEELNLKCLQFEENSIYNHDYDLLKKERDSLENVLHGNLPSFLAIESLSVKWQEVRSLLDDTDIAVDFVEIPLDDKDIIYAVYVVKKSYDYPKMVTLFRKSELSLSNQYPIVDESIAYSKIWHPLSSLLQGCENVYFSPAGILNRIAIEYLSDERGLPINWLYNMHRLSNLKELVFNVDSITSISKVCLIGGLDYDLDTNNDIYGTNNVKHRGALNSYYFSYLPSSLSEIQDVKNILEESKVSVEVFTGTSFPETSMTRFQGSEYDILHFATHGFCQDTQRKDSVGELEALSYSGIVLSRANEYFPQWSSDGNYTSTSCDNILTSLEISKMNLTKVNMVILSTCVSGLGIEGKDGIYGIQRAFKKAGVKSQLVSLWNIDDEATSIFITSFYRYYTQLNDMFRALKLAQQALCRANNGRYNHPKYWASFVLIDGMEKNPKGKRKIRFEPKTAPRFGLE